MLPATYPHVLAFALQMHLLTDKHFPFPLLGLVHLRNRIQVFTECAGPVELLKFFAILHLANKLQK